MSFDVNIGRSEPIIKAASNMNNDGGSGGNLGYMMGGRRKKEDQDKGSLFDNKDKFDSFELGGKPRSEKSFEDVGNSWFDNLVKKIIK